MSTKRVYRDVETLGEACIPISMQQGVSGGIVLNEYYGINKSKLTTSEEKILMKAIDDLKKLPNVQMDFALKFLKKYFNDAGTRWCGSIPMEERVIEINDEIVVLNMKVKEEVEKYNLLLRVSELKGFSKGSYNISNKSFLKNYYYETLNITRKESL